MELKIETKQELKYVMDFYNIPFVPIHDGKKDMGKITREMKYEPGHWRYNSGYEYLGFGLAYEQIKDIIALKENVRKPFKAILVYRVEEQTWNYPDVEGGIPCHHVYPKTVVRETENEIEGTMDEVFVTCFKSNNTMRYCNGHSYHFKDDKVSDMYYLWLKLMPEARHFDLYYGNGIVD